MRRLRRLASIGIRAAIGCCGFSVAAHGQPLSSADQGHLRPWTLETSVRMRHFVNPPSADSERATSCCEPYETATESVAVSPNGEYFLFITHYGDISSDSNVYELRIFAMRELEKAFDAGGPRREPPRPLRTVSMTSTSSRHAAIFAARWLNDSSGIAFGGMNAEGKIGIYRLSLNQATPVLLAPYEPDIVTGFIAGRDGVLFSKQEFPSPEPISEYPMILFHADPFTGREAMHPTRLLGPKLFAAYKGKITAAEGALNPKWNPSNPRMWVSADGRYVIAVVPAWPAPANWSAYGNPPEGVWMRYEMMDLETARVFVPIDAPIDPLTLAKNAPPSHAGRAEWCDDNDRVVLTGVLAGADRTKAQTVEFDASSRKATVVRRTGRTCRAPASRHYAVRVYVEQSASTPPVIVATKGKKRMPLLTPDPALKDVWIAPQKSFTWQGAQGAERGGLWLPHKEVPAGGFPLVIQNYRYFSESFMGDGYNSSVDAAQTLAAGGIAVLQMASADDPAYGTEAEGPNVVARLDAAVAALSRQGLIDASRVGLVGFSHAGYWTFYAITHPGEVHLAAAVCADSFTGSYTPYLELNIPAESVDQAYGVNGGAFWKNKAAWLKNETTFNVDHVVTPALFTTHGQKTVTSGEMSTIGAFALNGRPLQFAFFPSGAHQLVRPGERLASMGLVVDWLRFWLQGVETSVRGADASPQYEDWRAMRKKLQQPLSQPTKR